MRQWLRIEKKNIKQSICDVDPAKDVVCKWRDVSGRKKGATDVEPTKTIKDETAHLICMNNDHDHATRSIHTLELGWVVCTVPVSFLAVPV